MTTAFCSNCNRSFEPALKSDGEPYKTCPACLDSARRWKKEHHDENLKTSREWCRSHRDKISKHNRESHARHKETRNAQHRKYQQEHREAFRIREHKWRTDHPEQCAATHRKWLADHPHKVNEYSHAARARKNNATGTYTQEELNNQWHTQNGFCFYCGELIYKTINSQYHVEHKIPLSRGGSNDISNIVLSCETCNLRKNAKTAAEFVSLARLDLSSQSAQLWTEHHTGRIKLTWD